MKLTKTGMITMMLFAGSTALLAQEQSIALIGQAKFVSRESFGFVSDVLVGGNQIKGAPYSAEAVTENIQTLADGNRIVQKSTSMLYRDSLGRERREQTLSAIGPFTAQGNPLQIITISDPIAGVNYSLKSKDNVAIRFSGKMISAEAGVMQKFEVMTAPAASATWTAGAPFVAYNSSNATTTTAKTPKTEQLGWRLIEGVQAEGTRSTITIPAGEIGNDRPIDIVNEEWRSPDLQLIVLSKHTDPRMGENIYSLRNISRTEPSPALFQVPQGYTVQDRLP